MNYLRIFFFLSIAVSAQEIQQEVKLSTEKAIVFRNSAQVFATTQVALSKGNNTLVFKGLTPNINTQSIIISGLSGASIDHISFTTDYLHTPSVQEELMQIQIKLDDVLLSKSKLSNSINALEIEKDVLQKNQLAASKENNTSLEKLKAYATYYRTRFEEINNQQYLFKLQLEKLIGEQNALQKQKNQLENEVRENRGILTLNLSSPEKNSTQLKINYQAYDAGWEPSYELRVTDAASPLSFLYQANLFQHTGTDWNNIDLYISTGSPRSNFTAPVIYPHYLNFLQPPVVIRGTSSNRQMDDAVLMEYQSSPNAVSQSTVKSKDILKTETLASIVFHLGKNQQLNSSSIAVKRTLEQKNISASFIYQAIPSISKEVYLQAQISDWQNLDLVSGEAKLYLEDAYAGSTFIDAQSVEEELIISFGVDEAIRIEYKEIKSNESKTFFKNQQIREKTYEIEVVNTKSTLIDLVIKDRIPVAQNDAIKVEDLSIIEGELDKETGIITWKKNISSRQNWKTRFSYTIKYPKDRRINF